MSVGSLQKDLVIHADPKLLSDVRAWVKGLCQTCGLTDRVTMMMSLAVDEAVTAMLAHALDTNRRGDVCIRIDINETRFQAYIEDHTNHLTLNPANEAEWMAQLDRERRHQLGIFLMRKIMDEVSYLYKRGFQNDLELVKFLS